jgi:hypothetical protein
MNLMFQIKGKIGMDRSGFNAIPGVGRLLPSILSMAGHEAVDLSMIPRFIDISPKWRDCPNNLLAPPTSGLIRSLIAG